MNLSVNGKTQRILARLEQGPASMAELREACGVTGAEAKALWHLVKRLQDAGLIKRVITYSLTDKGASVLAELRTGRDVEVEDPGERGRPNVRIFGRAAA